ncbi:heterokaryon incompatibility protein-domain-containing protein [Pseudoneurospora amorphoporcata]|uniref:Heterokaryon incompatibility protein-domain-containing protein n=1 Tax=Pseudoneurospora amorphoporcata TaxID=241081 RepID=A0AAN6NTS9_9PEZI|nr:heterokaryon incompatibility protein-domain-containing protein [Pseudoneurospora amorphoporcata]
MAHASTTSQEPESAMVAAHVLCDACSRVFKESKWVIHLAGRAPVDDMPSSDHVDIFLHSLDKEQLKRSSAAGCHLCTMAIEDDQDWHDDDDETGVIQADVWYSVYAEVDDEKVCMTLRRITNILPSDFPSGDRDGIQRTLREQGGVDWQTRNQYENPISDMYLHWAKDTDVLYPRSMLRPGSQLPSSTASPDAITLARHWLINCLENHGECNTYLSKSMSSDNWLPTRLIDVGTEAGRLTPRLVIPSDSTSLAKIRYVTLSHSWAMSKKSLNLLVENLEELTWSIPLDALSQTFRDAMRITQQLGHRYIWIDSLCIIQNSTNDWQKEALLMSLVYGRSSCNIAAMGMPGVDGCFSQRNPLAFFPCRVTDTDDGGAVYALSQSQTPSTMFSAGGQAKPPLLYRGWVLQERILSPRIVYFGGPQLYWECCCERLAESWAFKSQLIMDRHLGISSAFSSKAHFRVLCDTSTVSNLETGSNPNALVSIKSMRFYLHWQEILSTYLETQLTFTTDRLIALAGIAKALEDHAGFTYIAGTWAELHPLDLLWRYKDTIVADPERRTVSGTNAPSWSWAAKEGERDFFPDRYDLAGEDTVVEVTYATDIRDFPRRTFSSQFNLDKQRKIVLSFNGKVKRGTAFTEELFPNSIREDDEVAEGKWKHRVLLHDEIAPITVRFDDPLPDGEPVLLLLLMEWYIYTGENPGKRYQGGLVLVSEQAPSGDSGSGQLYRRAGVFKTGEPGAFVHAFHDALSDDDLEIVKVC